MQDTALESYYAIARMWWCGVDWKRS